MAKRKELTSRQKQAIESKKRLAEAAAALFHENGYQNTTVQDICERAGLSVGVFYHYFASKQEALRAAEQEKHDELMRFIETRSQSKSHIEAILEMFGYICQQQTEGSFELVCNAFAPSVSQRAHRDFRLRDFVVEIIQSGQEVGEFTCDLPAMVIAEDLLDSARGYVFHWCEEGGNFDLFTEQQAYLRRILRAYAGPQAEL